VNPTNSPLASTGVEWQFFPALTFPGLKHGFSHRLPVAMPNPAAVLRASLPALGIRPGQVVQAEQVHGGAVACIENIPNGPVSGADALITRQPQIALLTRVADCGPVYFYDPRQKAIGLAHSGRKGTEANIAGATIREMTRQFGSDPTDLVAFLGPCIRPPHYEVDFAREIGRQIKNEGVTHYTDSGLCTASNLDIYYSYRAEKGKTGRLWGILMLE
jgi:copper oxidase (laccase) domain-containing protein